MEKANKVFNGMADERVFVGYRLDGKDKIPVNVKTGYNAKVNDVATWHRLDEVMAAVEAGRVAGLGVVLTGGLCGLDLDDCVSADGTRSPLASDVIAIMDSYWEYSISGTGIHILFRSDISMKSTTINHDGGKIEVYLGKRYFTFSGNYPDNDFRPIQERSKALTVVLERYGSKSGSKRTAPDKSYGNQNGENPVSVEHPIWGTLTPVPLWPLGGTSRQSKDADVSAQTVGIEQIHVLLEAIKRDGAEKHHAEIRAALSGYKFSDNIIEKVLNDKSPAPKYPERVQFKLLHLLSGHAERFRNNKGEIDDSRADFALMRTLMRYTKDAEEIETIMRSSGLNRDKYDTRRTLNNGEDGTYLSYSIQNALKQGRKREQD